MSKTSPTPPASAEATQASNTTADVAFVAVFTALVIVLGFVAIPAGALGVPIVIQNTALVLAALVLGLVALVLGVRVWLTSRGERRAGRARGRRGKGNVCSDRSR